METNIRCITTVLEVTRLSSEPRFGVRIPARPPKIWTWIIIKKYFGYPHIPEAGIRG